MTAATFGPPEDYAAAFGGSYPYETAYIEYQGWLTRNDGVQTPGHHSEHVHLGACLPLGQTLNDENGSAWSVDAKITAHNIEHYTVSSVAATFVGKGGSQPAFEATPEQVEEVNAAFLASGGLETTVVFQSYPVSIPKTGGIKELKWQLQMDRSSPEALVDFWRVNGRSYLTLDYAGHRTGVPLGDPTCFINFVRTQNWVEFDDENGVRRSQYLYAGFQESQMSNDGDCTHPAAFKPEALAQNRPDPWTTTLRTTDGANRLFAYVDPNFHSHPDTNVWSADLGDPHTTGVRVGGGFNNQITVPIGEVDLAGGVHRLMAQGHSWPTRPAVRPINTSIVVMPFAVAATDAEPPSAPPNLHPVNRRPATFKLVWNASTDNVAVTGYRVHMDGVVVQDSAALSRNFSEVPAGPHVYDVEAYDAAGNTSVKASLTLELPKG